MKRFFRRWLSFFRSTPIEDELAREMTAHLALLEDEQRRRGMTADEARLAARRAMGSVALAKDLHRDARSFVWLEDLRRDLRSRGARAATDPGFTLLAVLRSASASASTRRSSLSSTRSACAGCRSTRLSG